MVNDLSESNFRSILAACYSTTDPTTFRIPYRRNCTIQTEDGSFEDGNDERRKRAVEIFNRLLKLIPSHKKSTFRYLPFFLFPFRYFRYFSQDLVKLRLLTVMRFPPRPRSSGLMRMLSSPPILRVLSETLLATTTTRGASLSMVTL